MHYTITALSPSKQSVEVMRLRLLAVGAPQNAISVKPAHPGKSRLCAIAPCWMVLITVEVGHPGVSQPQITVKTDDLAASQSYRHALELAGGVHVAVNEESSTFNAVKIPRSPGRRERGKATTIISPPVKIWEEHGRWFVQVQLTGTAMSFATREEAIAYTISVFSDGGSGARAENPRGHDPLIPLSDQSPTNDPYESAELSDLSWFVVEDSNGVDEVLEDGFEIVKDSVEEVFRS
jgi:hypothetical protein